MAWVMFCSLSRQQLVLAGKFQAIARRHLDLLQRRPGAV